MGLLAPAMGFDEPWLHQTRRRGDRRGADGDGRATTRHLRGVTLERLQAEGAVPLAVPDEPPFADGRFPTPSGKVELYSRGAGGRRATTRCRAGSASRTTDDAAAATGRRR